ncbi:MAG TPA: TspO/MBR family protein, partial [Longimicrobiales bacterium]|nr:TspO/MBR family protein [Longimicrobiales bacterium]
AGVFGPVWSILYATMAIAAWLVVGALGWPRARGPMMLYGLQLALNAVWSWLFFRWRLGGAAFIDVLALLAVLLFTVRAFWRARPLAGALMLPYLAWVAFAATLTYAVWQRNPNVL